MPNTALVQPKMFLGDEAPWGRVEVYLAAFMKWDAAMDRRTQRLVAKWVEQAAPASRNVHPVRKQR